MSARWLLMCVILVSVNVTRAQEMNFSVNINTQKLSTVDVKIFQTLESTLQDFLNNQKWTSDIFEPEERIECNLLLTIQEELSPTTFSAELAIQSSRPIYGSDQKSLMINHLDRDLTFEYQQYDPLQFSRNSYTGNLSAVLSFYVHIILGMDYDSFAPFGGEQYFQLAQDILNAIPSTATASNPGWRPAENDRNRYWIIENILSPRMRPLRQAIYDYHRQALDVMHSNVATGRTVLVQALEKVQEANQAYPNSIFVRMFANAKSEEIVEIFKRGTSSEKSEVMRTMTRIDASNAAKYRAIR